jgi:multidrug efflux system outer membrane protein
MRGSQTRPVAMLAALLLAACAAGPNYHRPSLDVPVSFRGAGPVADAGQGAAVGAAAAAAPNAVSLGDEKWSQVFDDPVLQGLIRTALRQNYDARIAAARVLQAQAELGITRAQQYPFAAVGAQGFTERNPQISSAFPAYTANDAEVDLSVLWNLDFWGKYRRATEAARDQLLATQWGRRAVLTSVVSSVATGYFQLRELDLALQLSQNTLASRQKSLGLIDVLAKNGSASMLDVRQAEQLVYTATATIADLQRQIAQQENALSALLGNNPAPVARGRALTQQPDPPQVPAGLPSALLERRADVRQAEATLMAANAQIGVARAELFPSISLTGTAGFESYQLKRLFTGPATLWNAAAAVTQPVFAAGSLHAQVRVARAEEQQMLLGYRQTVMDAFREVSDALVAYRQGHEFRAQQQLLTDAARDTDRLSNLLYQHGGASYLQVLTSETNYFAAQLTLAQAQLDERLALVQLYNALGGGWAD